MGKQTPSVSLHGIGKAASFRETWFRQFHKKPTGRAETARVLGGGFSICGLTRKASVREQIVREQETCRTPLLPGFELQLARLLGVADDWPDE